MVYSFTNPLQNAAKQQIYAGLGASQPQITPKTTPGGGDAQPPYLQTRVPSPTGGTQPVVTPKPMVTPNEVAGGWADNKMGMPDKPAIGPTLPQPGGPPISPPGQKPQAGGQNLGDLYNFFKSDLEAQKNKSISKARADAAERGVFYGTPLTGSEADIETQFLRGLGQFSSGLYGNEQADELNRLRLANDVIGPGYQPEAPQPLDLSGIGSMFAGQPANPYGAAPQISPKNVIENPPAKAPAVTPKTIQPPAPGINPNIMSPINDPRLKYQGGPMITPYDQNKYGSMIY